MPIREAHCGRSYQLSEPYRVSHAKIAEFVAALGEDNPFYRDVGYAIAPPTFAAVIAARAWEPVFADPELGLVLERSVHADQRFNLTRLLRAGDEVSATAVIERVRTRGDADMVTIRVDLATAGGERLGSAVSQMICTREEA